MIPCKVKDMSPKQKEKIRKTAVKNCDGCVHKSICLLYHGHGQLELRFGSSYAKDPDKFIEKLDERLAYKCIHYMESKGSVGE